MEVISNDQFVSSSLIRYGEWAQNELDVMASLVRPGDTVLDVGAFIGTHTLAFAEFVGLAGSVVAFEPRIEAFETLEANIAINDLSNVTAHQLAVSSRPDTISLARIDLGAADNFGGVSLAPSSNGDERYIVDIVAIDDLDLPAVSFIKLDIEGMEHEALLGARTTIERCAPIIFAEVNSIESGNKIVEFARSLSLRVFGCLTDAYNADNFRACADNVFGDGKELGLILVSREESAPGVFDYVECLPEVHDCDDLAALLLCKPQYAHEVLNERIAGYVHSAEAASKERPAPGEQSICARNANVISELAVVTAETRRAEADHLAAVEAGLSDAQAIAFRHFDDLQKVNAEKEALQAEIVSLHGVLEDVRDANLQANARIVKADVKILEADARISQADARISQADATIAELTDRNAVLSARHDDLVDSVRQLISVLSRSRAVKTLGILSRRETAPLIEHVSELIEDRGD